MMNTMNMTCESFETIKTMAYDLQENLNESLQDSRLVEFFKLISSIIQHIFIPILTKCINYFSYTDYVMIFSFLLLFFLYKKGSLFTSLKKNTNEDELRNCYAKGIDGVCRYDAEGNIVSEDESEETETDENFRPLPGSEKYPENVDFGDVLQKGQYKGKAWKVNGLVFRGSLRRGFPPNIINSFDTNQLKWYKEYKKSKKVRVVR